MGGLELVVAILAVIALVTNAALAVVFGGWLRLVSVLAAAAAFTSFLLLLLR